MVALPRDTQWHLRHSLWILAALTLGILNWAAFLYIGLRARQSKWIGWSMVYSIPLFIVFVAQNRVRGGLESLAIATFFLMGIGSMIHAFVVRGEYLRYLVALEGNEASITGKGRAWEVMHSLWLSLTFTLGLLNWAAFLYIGLRTRHIKWLLWSVFYAFGIISIISIQNNGIRGWLYSFAQVFYILITAGSVSHAFVARREYLLRLAASEKAIGIQELEPQSKLSSVSLDLTHEHHDESLPLSAVSDAPHPPVHTESQPIPLSSRALHVDQERAISASNIDGPPLNSASRIAHQTPSTPPIKDAQPARKVEQVPTQAVAPAVPMNRATNDIEIAKSFPFPIAFGYRLLEGIVNPTDLYREQLRVAENLLAFLASVSLALVPEQDRVTTGINPHDYWRAGASPGDWKDIVARCSKVFGRYRDQPLTTAIHRLNIGSDQKGFGADVAMLIRAKNDFKHDRGPFTEEDIIRATVETQGALQRCVRALLFFTEYPIRQVFEINVNRRGDSFYVKCLRYTGDHPGLPQEEIVLPNPVHKGDLYIDIGDQHWVSLFPFITARNCPRCKQRETYFIDKWDTRRNIVYVKSFERGHSEETTELGTALEEWNPAKSEPA